MYTYFSHLCEILACLHSNHNTLMKKCLFAERDIWKLKQKGTFFYWFLCSLFFHYLFKSTKKYNIITLISEVHIVLKSLLNFHHTAGDIIQPETLLNAETVV